MSLPELRDELSLFNGAPSLTGAPTWSLHDPARNIYFKLDWLTFEILCRWNLGSLKDICIAINNETTLEIDVDAIETVEKFLRQNNLIKIISSEDTKRVERDFDRRQKSWYANAVQSYLFFRLPLFKPDKWISDTLPLVRWLGTKAFLQLTFLALLLGLMLVGRQWDTFTTYFIDLFSLEGLMAYAITLALIKVIHELGHGYVAKHFGCHVPSMGIAFLVMFPLAYTDVNDVWRLPEKTKRLKVGAAGIVVELVIAAWATFLWCLLPEGSLRTGFFLLSTTTWISTIIVNASPFLRFDGYFLLMDALDMPNLHSRAFAMGRWCLREALFKLGDTKPEVLPTSISRFLVIFSYAIWIYRLIVFGGIAILVYLMFPKPLGLLLAIIEVYVFILKPILIELNVWRLRWREIMKNYRTLATISLILVFLLIWSIPWDTRITTQAVISSSVNNPIIANSPGRIEKIFITNGARVQEGDSLIKIYSPELLAEKQILENKIEGLQYRIGLSQISELARPQISVLRAQLDKTYSELSSIENKLINFELRAPVAGEVHWIDLELREGDWIKKGEELGFISQSELLEVVGYVDQDALERLEVGNQAVFIDESGRLDAIPLKVNEIDVDATRVLREPLLASIHGGEILVREKASILQPEHSIYKISLQLVSPFSISITPKLRGKLTIRGNPEAWIDKYFRSFMVLMRREAGF